MNTPKVWKAFTRTLLFALVAALTLGPSALAAADTVNIGTVMLNGRQATVLTDARGMTLYYIAYPGPQPCTGECARIWPPLIVPTRHFTAPPTLRGQLRVVNTLNGPQLAYAGHPLYRFIEDTRPGETRGQGLQDPWGLWQVATPALGRGAGWGWGSGGYW